MWICLDVFIPHSFCYLLLMLCLKILFSVRGWVFLKIILTYLFWSCIFYFFSYSWICIVPIWFRSKDNNSCFSSPEEYKDPRMFLSHFTNFPCYTFQDLIPCFRSPALAATWPPSSSVLPSYSNQCLLRFIHMATCYILVCVTYFRF